MPDDEPIGDKLLSAPKDEYGPHYASHLLEQYKLYVEMADRISGRRMTTNTFFLTLQTGLVALLGLLIKEQPSSTNVWIALPAAAGIIFSYTWWRLVNSYRQLNTGKFAVIHQLEKLLPTAPYDAEWVALGSGKDPKRYRQLTDVEAFVPLAFAILHAAILLLILLIPAILNTIATATP